MNIRVGYPYKQNDALVSGAAGTPGIVYMDAGGGAQLNLTFRTEAGSPQLMNYDPAFPNQYLLEASADKGATMQIFGALGVGPDSADGSQALQSDRMYLSKGWNGGSIFLGANLWLYVHDTVNGIWLSVTDLFTNL